MNMLMKSQVETVLLSLRTLNQSIEVAALKDDGEISKEEQKEIKIIQRAIADFEKEMSKIL